MAENCHDTRSGTAVCRITTSAGKTSFELPLATRAPTAGKFHGLSQTDVIISSCRTASPTAIRSMINPPTRPLLMTVPIHAPITAATCAAFANIALLEGLGRNHSLAYARTEKRCSAGYHGYGAVDLYAVDPHLGTINDYQQLVLRPTSRK